MNDIKLNFREATSIFVMYLLGSSLVGAGSLSSSRDFWLSIVVAYAVTLPLALLYGRLMRLSPDKDLYDLQTELLGPVFGRVTSLLLTWFAFHLGSMIIRNCTEFIQLDSLRLQPQYITAIPIGILAIWCITSGRATLARWAAFMLPLFLTIVLVITLLSTKLWDLRNLLPFLDDGWKPVLRDARNIAAFPFAEAALLPFILHPLRETRKAEKLMVLSFTVTMLVYVFVMLRNILVLGTQYISMLYYPSYIAISLINIGDFLDRIEVLISTVFIIGAFVKITVCLYVASLGVSKVLSIGDSKSFAAPLGLLMIVLSQFVYANVIDSENFVAHYYPYYAAPFSVVLPALLWLLAELRRLRQKRRGVAPPLRPAAKGQSNPAPAPRKPEPEPDKKQQPPHVPAGDGKPATEV